MSILHLVKLLIIASLVAGCSGLSGTDLPTPIPESYLPTAIALTLEASGVRSITPQPPALPVPTETPTTLSPSASPTLLPNRLEPTHTEPGNSTAAPSENSPEASPATSTPTLPGASSTPDQQPSLPTLTALPTYTSPPPSLTPQPAVPLANIQILLLGELSLVTSPFLVWSKISVESGKTVRIELYGEDGRLLQRLLKEYPKSPWKTAALSMDLEYEISAAAELGRLVISVEDPFGRLTDVNSVNLVLLSSGATELNAPNPWQTIVIQEPVHKGLIQGGKLLVSGLARPSSDQPLRAALIAEDGRVLGQRLAGVSITTPGEHGVFAAEVPYTVSELTQALLVVYEEGGSVSDIAHLASLPVLLTP